MRKTKVQSTKIEAFSIASLVVPAEDSLLRDLGYDVRSLSLKALGLVQEIRKDKVFVLFPELKTSLWLDKKEVADVDYEATKGNINFIQLLKDIEDAAQKPLVWWVYRVAKKLDATHLLNMDKGSLQDLWEEKAEDLKKYFRQDEKINTTRVGLGLYELVLEDWHEAELFLGNKLMFARFLPAGLSKIELVLFLQD